MNILQVQDALKNASDQQLAGELQNPTGMAPSYLVLSELKRRQQMRQSSQSAQAPQGSMAEEAAGAAEPEYYPEEQPQEEAPGIEAFREGGVVRMQAGGRITGYSREELFDMLRSGRAPYGYTLDDVRRATMAPVMPSTPPLTQFPGGGLAEPPMPNPVNPTNDFINRFARGAGLVNQPEVEVLPEVASTNNRSESAAYNPSRPMSEWTDRELSSVGGMGPGAVGESSLISRNPVLRRFYRERQQGITEEMAREARLELARRAPASRRQPPLSEMNEENMPSPQGSVGASMEAETAPLRNFNPPRSPSVAPTEGQPSNELYGPPVPPRGQAVAASSPTRAGAGIGAVAAQPASQQEEGISSLYGRLRELSPSREEYRKDAANTALMQAGLAMMASKDPNALANLGAGGLRGLQAYTDEMRTGRAQQRQAIADEITARRANTEELYRRGLISNQERQLRLMEARLGQASAERAETREMNREMRLEQINQRNVAALGASLQGYTSEINRLQTELSNMMVGDTRRQALTSRLTQLQNESNSIRRRLAQVGGAEFDAVAQAENSGRPPPGQIRQPNLWPAPQ